MEPGSLPPRLCQCTAASALSIITQRLPISIHVPVGPSHTTPFIFIFIRAGHTLQTRPSPGDTPSHAQTPHRQISKAHPCKLSQCFLAPDTLLDLTSYAWWADPPGLTQRPGQTPKWQQLTSNHLQNDFFSELHGRAFLKGGTWDSEAPRSLTPHTPHYCSAISAPVTVFMGKIPRTTSPISPMSPVTR